MLPATSIIFSNVLIKVLLHSYFPLNAKPFPEIAHTLRNTNYSNCWFWACSSRVAWYNSAIILTLVSSVAWNLDKRDIVFLCSTLCTCKANLSRPWFQPSNSLSVKTSLFVVKLTLRWSFDNVWWHKEHVTMLFYGTQDKKGYFSKIDVCTIIFSWFFQIWRCQVDEMVW